MSQISYSGYLDKQPITLVLDYYEGEENVSAFYVYDKYDEAIIIDGKLNNNELTLFERNNDNSISATLLFSDFDKEKERISGKWINADSTDIYSILLKKDFNINSDLDEEGELRELLEQESTENHYFKILISKEIIRYSANHSGVSVSVSGVKIFEKKTDRLIQTFELKCTPRGMHNVSINDYNFDGISDFSVFEGYYAGSNTSEVYFLYNPKTKKYMESSISGTSLEFYNDTIYETNRCCLGTLESNSEYIIIGNTQVLIRERHHEMDTETGEMILTEEHCYKFDEETGESVEVKCE